MMITIGQTSDDRRKLNKAFTGTAISVTPKNPCDILRPTFILTWNNSFINANYLYCPDFARYYFIENIVLLTGSTAEIHCSVDVLMSYRDEISALTVSVRRNEKQRNKLVVDTSYPAEIMSTLTTLKFDRSPFNVDNGFNIVMTVLGGKMNEN